MYKQEIYDFSTFTVFYHCFSVVAVNTFRAKCNNVKGDQGWIFPDDNNATGDRDWIFQDDNNATEDRNWIFYEDNAIRDHGCIFPEDNHAM